MAKSVISAFNEFLNNYVNLKSTKSKKARNSRDWLMEQIHSFTDKDNTFPKLYPEKDIFYGSFARNTKIRELDDIDIMICISSNGSVYNDYSDNIQI